MFATRTIRPGFLVSLKTTVRGNVSYRKVDIEREHTVDGASVAKWETERTIADRDEYDKALKVRSAAAYSIARICASTSFGLLLPEEKQSEFDDAIKAAREMIEKFNDGAAVTRITLGVIAGRVARDDIEAARAVRTEVSELIEQMQQGVAKLNAESIRDAAKRARAIQAMLPDESKARVESAIELSRAKATAMVKAIKAGEVAAQEVDQVLLGRLDAIRTTFIDLDEAAEVKAPEVAARAIDMEPSPDVAPIAASPVAFDMGE